MCIAEKFDNRRAVFLCFFAPVAVNLLSGCIYIAKQVRYCFSDTKNLCWSHSWRSGALHKKIDDHLLPRLLCLDDCLHCSCQLQMCRMRQGDHGFFCKYYRMTPQLFDTLLSFVAADLTRLHLIREPLEPGERLAMTLRFVEVNAALWV